MGILKVEYFIIAKLGTNPYDIKHVVVLSAFCTVAISSGFKRVKSPLNLINRATAMWHDGENAGRRQAFCITSQLYVWERSLENRIEKNQEGLQGRPGESLGPDKQQLLKSLQITQKPQPFVMKLNAKAVRISWRSHASPQKTHSVKLLC